MQAILETSCNVVAGLKGLIRFVRLPGEPYLSKVETPFAKEGGKGFKCRCGTLCNKPVHIVLETRQKDYYETAVSETGHKMQAIVGYGAEIVREALVCPRCAAIHNGLITPGKD